MSLTLAELAAALGARCEGDGTLPLTGANEPQRAGPDELAMAMSPAWIARLPEGRARAAVLPEGADWQALGLAGAVFVARPRLALAGVTRALDPGPAMPAGRHPTAVVDPAAELAADVAVGPFTAIGAGARIGAGGRIGAQVTIAPGAEIGPGALIHPGVRIGPRVRIGAGVIIHANAVIGSDGFSFVSPERSRVEAVRTHLGGAAAAPPPTGWVRIHSLGGVAIGDDVEIGAGTTIDAGTLRPTEVGSGTKIDNLVQIGHNVVVGRDCLLCGQVGIAGSSRIGDRSVLAGQAGVGDNLRIGADCVISAGTKVLSNVPDGRVMMGYPAVAMDTQVEVYKALRRLPRLAAAFAAVQKTVKELSDKVGR